MSNKLAKAAKLARPLLEEHRLSIVESYTVQGPDGASGIPEDEEDALGTVALLDEALDALAEAGVR